MQRSVSDRAEVIPHLAEVFREHGFEGASLALISARTGLGKGSLYHFFPGGKEEMAAAVLDHISHWFEHHLFEPLRAQADPAAAIHAMFQTVDDYFRSGRRTCLVGTFALGDARDRFAAKIGAYFTAWQNALAEALERAGKDAPLADELAEDVIAGIQGALVMARAFDDPALFGRALQRLERYLDLQ
jgi:TetR/AcrR family transcriptional regulator, lmrAB and yxaGH operons repressor